MTAQFLAEPKSQIGKIDSRGRKRTYFVFATLLNGELHGDAYEYSRDLKIRFRSHVLPESHRLFAIMKARDLVALEVLGLPPMERARCCGWIIPKTAVGETLADLRYVSDEPRLRAHFRDCCEQMCCEEPLSGRCPVRRLAGADTVLMKRKPTTAPSTRELRFLSYPIDYDFYEESP